MKNDKYKMTGLPFQVSELPEGMSVNEKGLVAEPNTHGTVVLRLENKSVGKFDNNFTIHAKQNSNLKVVLFQNLNDQSHLNLNIITKADDGAQIDLLQFHLGGASVNGNIIQNANEQSAINTDLLCRTKDKQEYHFEVKNVYPKKNGRGKILAKGIALDKSRLTMNGGINIEQKGGGTDAHLKQDCLLLSRNAKIQATPGLQIDTNDVKAGHSASVTNLNDESLFYMTSRGIDEQTARKMLISGFVTEQLEKISDIPKLKEEIKQTI